MFLPNKKKVNIILENIFYINLKEREDRKKHVESELNELNWKYQRFEAIKANSGRVGCSMSHLKILKHAKENNLPYVVVMEDDIQFTNKKKYNSLLKDFMDRKINYDVLLLAGNLRKPIKKITPHILKIKKSFTTTGYIVKQHYYDAMIENIKQGIQNLIQDPSNGMNAIDVYWMKLQSKDNWYILYPRTITQLPDYSDIEKTEVNYNHLMLDS
mgnify:CR=1 FL=1